MANPNEPFPMFIATPLAIFTFCPVPTVYIPTAAFGPTETVPDVTFMFPPCEYIAVP